MTRLAPSTFRALAVVMLTAVALPGVIRAQSDLASSWMASRADLERRLSTLDQLVSSTAYSARMRQRATAEAERIRRRLSAGDFRVGDRIYLVVEGARPVNLQAAPSTLSDLQDTLTVLDGVRINPRGIGEISLAGVLRSELQGRVNTAVNEVILNSRAITRPLVRLAVFGAVGRPGYYTVPLETRLDALVMLAGGPTVESSTEEIQLVRGDTVVLDADEVRRAISDGLVVGEMDLREGDQVMIERQSQRLDRTQTLQFVFLFISPIVSALVFRVFQ